jgi:hypothetical protein
VCLYNMVEVDIIVPTILLVLGVFAFLAVCYDKIQTCYRPDPMWNQSGAGGSGQKITLPYDFL